MYACPGFQAGLAPTAGAAGLGFVDEIVSVTEAEEYFEPDALATFSTMAEGSKSEVERALI